VVLDNLNADADQPMLVVFPQRQRHDQYRGRGLAAAVAAVAAVRRPCEISGPGREGLGRT
jgi:hypothetical protein